MSAEPSELIDHQRYPIEVAGRVAPNTGADQRRLMLIMSFSERAGTVGSVERIRSLYCKVTDVHLAAAAAPMRADSLTPE